MEGLGVADRAGAGGKQEVAALFDRNYRSLCRLAYVMTSDESAAEEIVMEALLKTFAGWRRINDIDRAEAYLRRAVVNGCRSRLRRRASERKFDEKARLHRLPEDWSPEKRETERLVLEAVRSLPERQRAAVVLRYYEDLSEHQIAELLDCSVGTVKSQLSRARVSLEKTLGQSLGDER